MDSLIEPTPPIPTSSAYPTQIFADGGGDNVVSDSDDECFKDEVDAEDTTGGTVGGETEEREEEEQEEFGLLSFATFTTHEEMLRDVETSVNVPRQQDVKASASPANIRPQEWGEEWREEEGRPDPLTSSISIVSTPLYSQGSLSSASSPKPHHRFSLPHLVMPREDYDVHYSSSYNSHGFYNSVEVEIDPFAKEFQASLATGHADGATNATATSSLNRSHFSTSAKEIPEKAFQDDNFLNYIKGLDHEVELKDYITFQMRVIGDKLEEKYAQELNQAIDDVFYEVVKENLTWKTFSSASSELIESTGIRDGLMLIPCFARQLIEIVPSLGSRLGHFTEVMLDAHASSSVLGMSRLVSQNLCFSHSI